jgi:hypothetical protein
MSIWLRPTLGLIAGCIVYYLSLLYHEGLMASQLLPLSIALTFPLFALQIKAPKKNWLQGLIILIAMGLVYAWVLHGLIADQGNVTSMLNPILIGQCTISAFIFFIFYCTIMEEGAFIAPYVTLFSQAWQVILKVSLAKILILLTMGLFFLAAMLFEQLNILTIREIVISSAFTYIMPALLFGVAMTLLHRCEDIITKLRNIVLAFSRFLYPIVVIISIGFLLAIPFAEKPFARFWELTVLLNVISLVLFNGIFQGGVEKAPYPRWFCGLIYVFFFLQLFYSIDVLQYPWNGVLLQHDPVSLLFLIALAFLALYNACYTVAIFSSKKSWLNLIQPANTFIALLIATIYLVIALPGVHLIAPA